MNKLIKYNHFKVTFYYEKTDHKSTIIWTTIKHKTKKQAIGYFLQEAKMSNAILDNLVCTSSNKLIYSASITSTIIHTWRNNKFACIFAVVLLLILVTYLISGQQYLLDIHNGVK